MLLEWGSCGRVLYVDDVAAGFAVYARRASPGAEALPTAPVSEDAVLLSTALVRPEYTGGGLGRVLMQGVVKDLVKRGGIRASGGVRGHPGRRRGARPTRRSLRAPPTTCSGVGFKTQRPHRATPRMRLDLKSGGHLAQRGRGRAGEAARCGPPDAAAAPPTAAAPRPARPRPGVPAAQQRRRAARRGAAARSGCRSRG